jgi:hypothetical protein
MYNMYNHLDFDHCTDLAFLIGVQLPPELSNDLSINVPLVSVNLLISHRF